MNKTTFLFFVALQAYSALTQKQSKKKDDAKKKSKLQCDQDNDEMLKIMHNLKSNKCLVSGSKATGRRRLQSTTKRTKCEELSDKLQDAIQSKDKNVTKATNALTEASQKYTEGQCGKSYNL